MIRAAFLVVALCYAVYGVDVHDMGERNGVTVSLEGAGVHLATKESLGSFYCGSNCEWLFTTDEVCDDIKWNIVGFKRGDVQCYTLEKAAGYSAGQLMSGSHKKKWDEDYVGQTEEDPKDDDKCWQFVKVGQDAYKIMKKFGKSESDGKYLRAPPVTFKETYVPRTRRYVRISADDSDNVWIIKSA